MMKKTLLVSVLLVALLLCSCAAETAAAVPSPAAPSPVASPEPVPPVPETPSVTVRLAPVEIAISGAIEPTAPKGELSEPVAIVSGTPVKDAPEAGGPPANALSGAVNNQAEEYVETASYSSGTYKDVGGMEWSYEYAVPAFLSASPDAALYNDMIRALLTPLIDEANSLMDDGLSISLTEIGYSAYQNDGVVSLVIRVDYDGTSEEYVVYNLKLSSDGVMKAADNTDLFSRAAVSASGASLEELTAACVGNAFIAQYGKEIDNEYIRDCYDRTLEPQNLSTTKYYLGEDGKLMGIVNFFSVAGAGHYYRTLEITA